MATDPKKIQPGESREAYKARSEAAAKASRDKLSANIKARTEEGKRRRYGHNIIGAGGKGGMDAVLPKKGSATPTAPATKPTKPAARPSAPAPKASRGRAAPGQGGQKYQSKPMSETSSLSGRKAGEGKPSKGRKIISALGKAWRNRDAEKSRKEFLDH